MNDLSKEKKAKNAAIFIVVAFLVGATVGYIANDLITPEYQFEVGENILQDSGFEEGSEDVPMYWHQAIIPAENSLDLPSTVFSLTL